MISFSKMTGSILAPTLMSGLLLVSCASPQPLEPTLSQVPPNSEPSASSVVAEVRDLTPVLALQASVRTGTAYQITADFAGIVGRSEGGLLRVTSGGESQVQEVDLQALGLEYEVLVDEGSEVAKGAPLLRSVEAGFSLVAPVSGATLLRFLEPPLSAKGQIEGVSEPFDCELLDESPQLGVDGSFIACRVPHTQRVLEGLPGVLAVQFETVVDATVLPIEAVAGTVDSGSAFRKTATGIEEIRVILGAIDGSSVQIVDGVEPGEEVLIPSPSMLVEER